MKNIIYITIVLIVFNICYFARAEVIVNTDEEVQTITVPILNNILEGIKTSDYAMYSKDFDETMKEAMPKTKFLLSNMHIETLFGKYLSHNYLGFLKKGNMTVTLWKAHYDKTDNDILIRLTLLRRGDQYLVTGLFFQ